MAYTWISYSQCVSLRNVCDFDVPKYLHLLSAIAQVLVLAFFTAMFRVLVGIPRMSLGHLSEHELYTIYTYSGTLGCNWACPSTNAFKQAFRQPLFCWSPRSVYILSTSIVRQPWNLLSSLGHNFLTWWCTLCTRRPKQTASDFQALSPPDPNPLSCVASIMCSRNVIIPTPPQPTAIYTPCTKYM